MVKTALCRHFQSPGDPGFPNPGSQKCQKRRPVLFPTMSDSLPDNVRSCSRQCQNGRSGLRILDLLSNRMQNFFQNVHFMITFLGYHSVWLHIYSNILCLVLFPTMSGSAPDNVWCCSQQCPVLFPTASGLAIQTQGLAPQG